MEDTAANSHMHALTLMDQGRYDLAAARWRDVISADPENADAFTYLALCLSHTGDRSAALSAADRALELDPSQGNAHYAKASVYAAMNRPREAEASIRRALEIDHDDASNWSLLAIIQLNQNQCREALQAAEKGLELDADRTELLSTRAAARTRLGETTGLDDARLALAKDPTDGYAHTTLAYALLRDGQVQEALTHFREALRIDPDSEYAREGMLEALRARSLIYRPALWFNQWIQRFPLVSVLIGAVVFMIVLEFAGRSFAGTAAQPWFALARSFLRAGMALVIFSGPLINAAMRFDRDARYVLKPREARLAAITAVCVLVYIALTFTRAFLSHPIYIYAGVLSMGPAFTSIMVSILGRRKPQMVGDWLVWIVIAVALIALVGSIVFQYASPLRGLMTMLFIVDNAKYMLVPAILLWLWDSFGGDKE